MKQSKAFYLAELSVLRDKELSYAEALEIIHVLVHEEEMAKFSEEREEKNEEVNNNA